MAKSNFRPYTTEEEQEVLQFLKSDKAEKYIECYQLKEKKVDIHSLIENKAKGKYYSKAKYNALIVFTSHALKSDDIDARVASLTAVLKERMCGQIAPS